MGDLDANWTVTNFNDNKEAGTFDIKSTSVNNKWDIAISDYILDPTYKCDSEISIELLGVNEQKYNLYSMSGNGEFIDMDGSGMNINFKIEEPLTNIGHKIYYELGYSNNNRYNDVSNYNDINITYTLTLFNGGVVDMAMTSQSNHKPEKVVADMTLSQGNNVRVKITFRGIYEIWEKWEHYDPYPYN